MSILYQRQENCRWHKCKNFCLAKTDNIFHLQKHHQYYYQVQAQIHLTQSTFCDFVVWTQTDIHVERIFADTDFWNAAVKNVKAFYITGVLPELLAKYFTRNCPSVTLNLDNPSGVCYCKTSKETELLTCASEKVLCYYVLSQNMFRFESQTKKELALP